MTTAPHLTRRGSRSRGSPPRPPPERGRVLHPARSARGARRRLAPGRSRRGAAVLGEPGVDDRRGHYRAAGRGASRVGQAGRLGAASVVEGLASVIVIWRLTGTRKLSDTSERAAQRGVAVSFWLLAPYVAVQAVRDLLTGSHPAASRLGIALTLSSVLLMPALGRAKRRLGGHSRRRRTEHALCLSRRRSPGRAGRERRRRRVVARRARRSRRGRDRGHRRPQSVARANNAAKHSHHSAPMRPAARSSARPSDNKPARSRSAAAPAAHSPGVRSGGVLFGRVQRLVGPQQRLGQPECLLRPFPSGHRGVRDARRGAQVRAGAPSTPPSAASVAGTAR